MYHHPSLVGTSQCTSATKRIAQVILFYNVSAKDPD